MSFGPVSFSAGKPMDVAPHPHIGLQTVSWLFEGEIAHDDSLGSTALLRPGGSPHFFLPIRLAMSLTTRSHTARAVA